MNFDQMYQYYGAANNMIDQADQEANVKPVTQTITTNPVSGEQIMTIKGRPQDLSASNPNTPTVIPPMTDTYRRMIQAESGGRDYDAQGRPLTSPAGAMFSSQVMPATAAAPGYGVRPAQDQTAEEYNRVGREYYDAMLKRFGTPTAAAAAYNAGPGRVQANMAANQGQLNISQLPAETQQYLQRVQPGAPAAPVAPVAPTAQTQPNLLQRTMGPVLNAMVPSAQAQPQMPGQPPAQPQAQPQPQPGAQPFAQLRPPETVSLLPPMLNDFYANQANPEYMARLRYDKTAPAWLKQMASSQEYDYLTAERKRAEAQQNLTQALTTGDTKSVAKALTDKSEEGSWLKMLLLGYISPQLAGREADKLGLTATWQPSMLGDQQVTAKFRQDGTAIAGRYVSGDKMGQELSQEELKLLYGQATGAGANKADYVGGTVINDRLGQIGRVVTRNGRTMVESNGRLFPATNEWRNNTVGTDVALAARMALVEIQKRGAGKAAEVISETNAKYGTNFTADPTGIATLQRIAGGDTTQAAPAAAPGAVVPQAAATPAAGGPATPAQAEARGAAQKDIAKTAGEVVSASQDTQNLINKIDNTIVPILTSGEHNIGSVLSAAVGRGPIAQAIGGQFETEQAKNTRSILETVDMLAIEGLKSLGANPSTRDLEFYTKNKPQASSDPDFVKEWIQSRSAALKRKLGYAEAQVGTGGAAGVAPPVTNTAPPGSQANPIKLK